MKTHVRALRPNDADVIMALYADAGWSFKPASPAFLGRALRSGQPAVGIFAGDDLVAMGRAVSDGHMAFLVDVIVHRTWRGRGLGRRTIAALEECLRGQGVYWIGLHATPSTEGFYRELGYRPAANGVAMEKDC
jgi:GNAT superfamily N-acetyltransferase